MLPQGLSLSRHLYAFSRLSVTTTAPWPSSSLYALVVLGMLHAVFKSRGPLMGSGQLPIKGSNDRATQQDAWITIMPEQS